MVDLGPLCVYNGFPILSYFSETPLQVVDGTHVSTGKHYAIKILNKAQLVKEKMSQSAVAEKNALATLSAGDHPGVIKLFSAFQDSTSLCMCSFFLCAIYVLKLDRFCLILGSER